jgi:hypothetical protein
VDDTGQVVGRSAGEVGEQDNDSFSYLSFSSISEEGEGK